MDICLLAKIGLAVLGAAGLGLLRSFGGPVGIAVGAAAFYFLLSEHVSFVFLLTY